MTSAAWRDRRVIVAGGTAGFGLVLARHLARHGARVLVVGRSGAGVRQALEKLDADGAGRARGLAADLGRAGEGSRIVDETLRTLGGVDDVFFCVGRSGRAEIMRTDAATLREYFEANVSSAVELTRAAADDVAVARGHLVYVGSLAGKLVTPFMGPYCVAKSALAAYVDAVRLELAPRGVHVLLVSPGPIRRDDDDPRADDGADRYAADVARSGLPPEAAAPGGSGSLRRLDPERLAAAVLDACRRRRCELVMPRSAGLLAGLVEWCPEWGRRLLAAVTGTDSR
jgi:NAD(P)-dependent dehydrogenase (short-subunit alcohol dehydrogenase family)